MAQPSRPAIRAPARPSPHWRMPRTVMALMLREMATSYGRSPGGYLWAILEPVGAIVVLTLVFSLMMRSPQLGNSFPLFYASGFLPFVLFNSISNLMAASIRFSRPLLTYPAVTFIDALLARFLLSILTQLLIGLILISGILNLTHAQTLLNIPRILEAIALAAVLGFSVGVLNCYLMSAFPLWERAWQIFTRPLFLLSGVIILFESMPPFAREILWWNPVMHIVGIARSGVYSTYQASYASPVYVLFIACAVLVPGLLLLHRYSKDLLQD